MLNISEKDYWPLAKKAVTAFTRNRFDKFFSQDDLDDLISAVVSSMWEKRAQYDESRGAVTTWVGTIAKNAVLDAAKKEKRRRSLFSSAPLVERVDEDGDALGFTPVASDETDAQAIAHDTERALRKAAPAGRDTRILDGLIQGQEDSELAASEGVKTSAIHTAKSRLRKRLRSAL